jgi:hypothetical protein
MLVMIEEGCFGAVMRRFLHAAFLAALSLTFLAAADRAEAGVRVQIDRASQTMEVSLDGAHLYTWKVSTARPGYRTPTGVFHPQMLAARWFSHVYYNAPMPHAIFFHGGFAIHGKRDFTARRTGLAWLRAVASRRRGDPVRIGAAGRYA